MKYTAEYLDRMRKSYQFRTIGVEPQWTPYVPGDLDGFVHDEVVRQFHDPRVPEDGGVRVRWMKNAWDYARRQERKPTLQDIEMLGRLIEPRVNLNGFRTYNIYIAGRMGPPPKYVLGLVNVLAHQVPNVRPEQGLVGAKPNGFTVEGFAAEVEELETVDDWYLAYEWIHPFGDGNGRSGKVLHNWLLGTLDDPVLVEDYFGQGNP